jgi:hypothetical protein
MRPSPGNQLAFVFGAPTIVPQGDGSVLVRPGKPLTWLTPNQLAAQFRVHRQSIYRWRDEGLIPEHLMRFAGKRKLQISAEVVPLLEAHFRRIRE